MAKKNKIYSFSVLGIFMDTNADKVTLENWMNNQLRHKMLFTYDKISDNEVEVSIQRNLPYAITGELIADFDMALLLGMNMECFMPEALGGKPIIGHLIPFGENFYAPIEEFKEIYKIVNEKRCDTEVKDIVITPKDDRIIMRLKF